MVTKSDDDEEQPCCSNDATGINFAPLSKVWQNYIAQLQENDENKESTSAKSSSVIMGNNSENSVAPTDDMEKIFWSFSSARDSTSNDDRSMYELKSEIEQNRVSKEQHINVTSELQSPFASKNSAIIGKKSVQSQPVENDSQQFPAQSVSKKPGMRKLNFDGMEPVPNVRDAMRKTLTQLSSKDWQDRFDGLQSLLPLILFHVHTVLKHIYVVCASLANCVRSLRKSLSRAACQVCTKLFEQSIAGLEQYTDDLLNAILACSVESTNDLNSYAMIALKSMCHEFSLNKSLSFITDKAAAHRNPIIRRNAAQLLFDLVNNLGCKRVWFDLEPHMRKAILVTSAKMLLEGRPDTRFVAKNTLRMLKNNYGFYRIVKQELPTNLFRSVEKFINLI